jgi:predicted alpha-1,6-mannanase (GH76 family)
MKIAGILLFFFCVLSAGAFTPGDADVAFDSFNAKFYVAGAGRGYYKKDTDGGRSTFWEQAEEIEMIEDAYARTGSAESRRMITASIAGFTDHFGADWTHNKFNDDIIWMTIACARGYLATTNQVFLDLAQKHFRAVCDRGWDTRLGGGIWWTTDRTCKNACINGPAALAAGLLFQITGDKAYLAGGKMIYAWERRTLFNPATGAVRDNIRANGHIGGPVFTYNQGTFIGAADLLWKLTGDTNYFNDALRAVDYTKNDLCPDGILPGYGSGDAAGFNGIFIRWLGRFATDNQLWPKYYDWMARNANAAWRARNPDNLAWQKWRLPTPPGPLESWNCSDAVVILQVMGKQGMMKAE